jgi:antitoxin MazE
MSFSLGIRRIQKNKYTFHCPLPTSWAKNVKLDQSSLVNIDLMDDGSIRITPVPQPGQGIEGTRALTTASRSVPAYER